MAEFLKVTQFSVCVCVCVFFRGDLQMQPGGGSGSCRSGDSGLNLEGKY